MFYSHHFLIMCILAHSIEQRLWRNNLQASLHVTLHMRSQQNNTLKMKWTKMPISKTSLHHLPLFLLVLTIKGQVKGTGSPNDDDSICDNGKLNIDLDLGGEDNWKCVTNTIFTKLTYHKPSPVPTCSNADDFEPKYRCMDEILQYEAHPPTVGDYRPVAPLYGDYEFLPPQRWLHALKLGGVAFLYHPCVPQDQVTLLKHLAQSCLWKHIISPYPYLSEDEPLALVAWGCSYRMEWVHQDSVKTWLKQNAMNTDQGLDSTVGTYDEKLITGSDEKLKAQSVCPIEDSPTSTISIDTPTGSTYLPENYTEPSHTSNETPCSSNSEDGNSESTITGNTGCNNTMSTPLIVVDASYHRVTLLIALALVILLLALLMVLWRLWSNYCRRGRTKGRYKSVSKYFPMTASVGGRREVLVTIPEMGLPKDGYSEREKLLEESDEDEL